MTAKLKRGITKVKDPGSALTHFIAMILAIIAAIPLLSKAGHDSGHMHISALAIFILSMIGLYAASTIYHTLDISPKINKLLRKIDHMMIFILIAGTYTPVCMIVLGDKTGWTMLTLVWGIAIVGILINALWITCPKWFSSLIYIAMGWVCILAITKILSSMPRAGNPQSVDKDTHNGNAPHEACPGQASCGFWQAVSSIQWAALFMP